MLSSRWPRSPSHGKCSKRFCGSSRSYGRSHHQRQRETFDVMHSRAADRRSASKCQGKWPDQTLDQAFGLPEVLVAVSTSRLSCKRAGKTRTLLPVWDSSGESRVMLPILTSDLYNYLALAVMLLAILFGYRKGRDVVSVSSQSLAWTQVPLTNCVCDSFNRSKRLRYNYLSWLQVRFNSARTLWVSFFNIHPRTAI